MALELVREVDADEKNSVKLGNVGGREEGVGWARGGGGGGGGVSNSSANRGIDQRLRTWPNR